MCTINEDDMIHGSSDIKHDRHVFCNFGSFLPFYPTKNQKNQNFERKKKRLEISPLWTSVLKIMIICYIVPEILHVTDVTVSCHFRLFFALLPPRKDRRTDRKSDLQKWVPHLKIKWQDIYQVKWCLIKKFFKDI